MATIIEVQDSKIEHISEMAEKVLKYGGKLMQCLEEISDKSGYGERYGNRGGRGGMRDWGRNDYSTWDREEKEYPRYY